MFGLQSTNIIAYMLDSLVRVSRRVGKKSHTKYTASRRAAGPQGDAEALTLRGV